MKRRLTGQQIIEQNDNVQAFELLEYMRNGLQAYTVGGRKVIDEDALEHGRKETLEEIKAKYRAKVKTSSFHNIGDINSYQLPVAHSEYSLDDFIDKLSKRAYELQPFDIILNPPEDSYLMSFKLPAAPEAAEKLLNTILTLCFKIKDVERAGLISVLPPPVTPVPTQEEPDVSLQQATPKEMHTGETPLNGYKEISKHFGVNVDTVRKTYKQQGCPIKKYNGRVYAYPTGLNAWKDSKSKKNKKK